MAKEQGPFVIRMENGQYFHGLSPDDDKVQTTLDLAAALTFTTRWDALVECGRSPKFSQASIRSKPRLEEETAAEKTPL